MFPLASSCVPKDNKNGKNKQINKAVVPATFNQKKDVINNIILLFLLMSTLYMYMVGTVTVKIRKL